MSTTGLRERKKLATRGQLHRAALELVLAHGPAHVTVEQIAAGADVSTRTFFNYFPTKESAIVGTDPDLAAEIVADFEARPPGEGLLTTLETVWRARLSKVVADAALRRLRSEVFGRHPEFVAAAAGSASGVDAAVRAAAARRLGVDPRVDPRPALYVGCAGAVVKAALATPDADLDQSLAAGFAALRTGLPDTP